MGFFTRFSLRNPAAIVLLSILVAVAGWFSATKFKQEQMPEVAYPYISVVAVYPGATPEEVLNSVTVPLEKALRNVDGAKSVTSSSSNSVAGLQMEFSFSDDMEVKKQKVQEAIQTVQLPEEVAAPAVQSYSTSNEAALYTSVFAKEGVTQEEMTGLVQSKVLPALASIEGVAKLETAGLKDGGVFLQLDAARMEAKQIGYQQVAQALTANNLSVPLGEVTLQKVRTPVLISGSMNGVDALKSILVAPGVKVGDIGDVKQGKDETVISRTDGLPSVAINIFKTGNANTVEVSGKVLKVYEDMKQEGKLDSLILYDRAVEVKESVSSMVREGGLGALFASILILFFLRNVRATLIAVVSIPMSILVAMIALKNFTDVTLNIMTLGGMAVATGRVVDDSIVVIENVVRRLQKEKPSKELILSSTQEVGRAITASTITTIAVFAPLGLLQGMVGEFFRPFALTVGFSLAASLLVALTVVPLMSWALMKNHVPKEHGESIMGRGYKKALRWSLNHKITVLAVSAVLFVGSLPLLQLVGLTFLPETDYKYVFANYQMPKGTELSLVDAEAKKIDEILQASEEVTATNVSVGRNNNGAIITHTAEFFIALTSDTDVDQFLEKMRPKITVPAGSTFDFVEDMGGGQIAITVTGSNMEDIRKGTGAITETVKGLEGTANVKNNLVEGTKGVHILVRGEDAARNGLSVAQASMLLRPILTEQKIGRIGGGTQASELYLSVKNADVSSLTAIEGLKLQTPLGTQVRVKDIADVKEVQLPSNLQLKNGSEFATVTASITDKDTNKVNGKLKDVLKGLQLPSGVEYSMGGSSEEIEGMLSDMLLAMAIACGMVYIVMVVTFHEARAPLAILFSLPFAFVGGMVGTWVAGEPISISSLIGFLMLIGIVVTNAIVLVERVHQQLEHGATIRDALIEAGGTRLRPILMTAIATICALIPLAIGLGGGSIISGGLAVIVIGGLATSTILTLVMVPVMYELLHFRRSRRERRATAKHSSVAA
jgi:hydrophobic/amphiphilic exporter-1 (mainly G- bacteria), HAE1 family